MYKLLHSSSLKLSLFSIKFISIFLEFLGNSKFKKLECEVYGVSKDNLKSHDKFRDKYKIKFDLLADEELKVLKKYKVWGKKKFMGREFMGILRTTFLIDKKGKIIKIWDNVKVKDHAKEVLDTLKDISK